MQFLKQDLIIYQGYVIDNTRTWGSWQAIFGASVGQKAIIVVPLIHGMKIYSML